MSHEPFPLPSEDLKCGSVPIDVLYDNPLSLGTGFDFIHVDMTWPKRESNTLQVSNQTRTVGKNCEIHVLPRVVELAFPQFHDGLLVKFCNCSPDTDVSATALMRFWSLPPTTFDPKFSITTLQSCCTAFQWPGGGLCSCH